MSRRRNFSAKFKSDLYITRCTQLYKKRMLRFVLLLFFLLGIWNVCKEESESFGYVKKAAPPGEEIFGEINLQELLPSLPVIEYEKTYIDDRERRIDGNIVGYTYKNRWDAGYVRDPDYILPEELIGRGIYVSEHMAETEIFLGQQLQELLTEKGIVHKEDRQYYTDWALQQLGEVNWELLDDGWEPEPFEYGREYEPMNMPKVQYEFHYDFYPRQQSITTTETQVVGIKLLVDEDGVIVSINVNILAVETSKSSLKDYVNYLGLFPNWYSEMLIKDGNTDKKIMLDYEMYEWEIDEDHTSQELSEASIQAENIAEICIDMLESRGEHAPKYQEYFHYDSYYEVFLNCPWDEIGADWKAGENYSCEYIDRLEMTGSFGYCYYFYPNFEAMETDRGKAAIVSCRIDNFKKMLSYIGLLVFEVSKEDVSEKKQSGIQIVEAGKVAEGTGSIYVPVPQTKLQCVLLRDHKNDWQKRAGVDYVKKEMYGCKEMSELALYIRERLIEDIKDQGNNYDHDGVINSLGESRLRNFFDGVGNDWEAGEKYDCVYIKQNERAGCVHLRYYFYPEETEKEREYVLVLDAYVSEEAIESTVSILCQLKES